MVFGNESYRNNAKRVRRLIDVFQANCGEILNWFLDDNLNLVFIFKDSSSAEKAFSLNGYQMAPNDNIKLVVIFCHDESPPKGTWNPSRNPAARSKRSGDDNGQGDNKSTNKRSRNESGHGHGGK
jgi:hypothetical protein